MKIAFVIHSLDGGGAERVLASLASRLAVAGNEVTLITLDDGARDKHDLDAAVERHELDLLGESRGVLQKVRNTRARVEGVRSALRHISPEVILSFCDRTNILTLKAAHPLRIPVVVSERSDPAQQHLGLLWEHLRNRTYRNAKTIVALTETAANHLRQRFAVNVCVIPSAVDIPPCMSDRQRAGTNRRIVGIGRLEHEKGFDRLIEAFGRLSLAHPDWTLRIFGEGSKRRSLEQQVSELGLGDRVSLPGWVRPVWDELGAATIFALPSRYEGFPSALLEAMAMGVPSVAVDCESGARAVIENAYQGLLVRNDVDALADGMLKLIENETLREQIGAGGADVVERFSWDKMVPRYEAVLRSAAERSAEAN